MKYELRVKQSRMIATGIELNGGFIRIFDESGDIILGELPLPDPCGTVEGDILVLNCEPSLECLATGKGNAGSAVIFGADKQPRVTDLSVGDKKSKADIRLDNVNIAIGQKIELDGAVFQHA